MEPAKRKPEEDTDWGEEVAKRPKSSHDSVQWELQFVGDFGSLTSQRPQRTKQPPMRFADTIPETPPKKFKRRSNQPVVKTKLTNPPNKSNIESKAERKRPAEKNNQPEPEAAVDCADVTSQVPGRWSPIVHLKITLDNTSQITQPRRSALHHEDAAPERVPSSQFVSVPTQALSPKTFLPNKQDQCAQDQPPPIPASNQGVPSPIVSPNEYSSIQKTWMPQTPEDSPCKGLVSLSHESFKTPQRRSWQDAEGSLTYPTPGSTAHHDADIIQNNVDLPVAENHNPVLPFYSPWSLPLSTSLAAPVSSTYAESGVSTEFKDTIESHYNDPVSMVETQHLHTIAEQLLAQRNVGPNKPEPSGQPEVWADGRQELCETLHYYRSYQSGCYSTGGFVRGFMFDKVAHPRDYMDADVIISRAGGGLTKDKESGEMKAGRDQSEDTVAQALRNCMVHSNPVVITAGIDNPRIPSKPPHQYCVLDYFKPTHIWVEKSGNSKVVRYRFEKLNTKKESWWRPKDVVQPVELGALPPPNAKTCKLCSVLSPQIYLNGWMCLQPTCTSFWRIFISTPESGRKETSYEPDEVSLIYDPRFLKQKTPWHNDDHDYPLISNTAELSGHSIPGEDTSVAFWSGMVCPKCGRCISRLNWVGWECSNATCDYTRAPTHTLISSLSLRDPLWPVTSSYTLSRDTQGPLVDVQIFFKNGYRINRYNLSGIDGFITHMIANKTVLEEQGGPDAMFEELQQTDIGLQRRSMPNGKLKGPNYCRHFAVNYGMPYKFIAATASQSFDGAARPITSTRSRLNWAAKLLLTQERGKSMEEVNEEWKDREFNEVLALGYFEEQKINYHDDGEFGLGPTIATLSLGAPGTMYIRMKALHYHGVSAAGVYDDTPPIRGCQQYDTRLALQPSLETLKQSDSRAYTAKRKQIPKDLGLKSRGHARDVLTMQLGHGDIVIMHGAELQKYYEHAVEHTGKLRFALTCRYIDPHSLRLEDKPTYEVGPDMEGYDGSRLA
ncbi:hypothetical protein EJ02DRAFT_431416 [Clathrospora elynae]|uniref:Alpha-ketoglutarate-dependent dioxygenase AlkB-like domain-containing protein n=1 Tax=Clathrospora elynae TaxID=706981 RepID=A0A6A5T1R6_9PLEO|nr:hypothetical protein EJ02DRAFT_431416 [Clathrospora elynae]